MESQRRTLLRLDLLLPIPACLEFASRSESFAFEPAVQLRSISSLTGLTACRPSANSLPQAGEGGLTIFRVTIRKKGSFRNVVSDNSFLLVAFFSFFGSVSFSFTRNKRERNEQQTSCLLRRLRPCWKPF